MVVFWTRSELPNYTHETFAIVFANANFTDSALLPARTYAMYLIVVVREARQRRVD